MLVVQEHPLPPKMVSMARDRLCPAVAGVVFDVGVSFSSSFPLSLPPPSLEVWMELAEEGGLQASILDSFGVAAPAVLFRTPIPQSQPHRHLGACPCRGRENLSLRRTEELG